MDGAALFQAIAQQAWAGNSKWIVELRQSLAANPELVHATQADGSTPLHKSFSYAFLVQELVSHGADVNIRNKAGLTPLSYAAKWVRADVMKILIEHGADVNVAGEEGKTPLHWAALRGRSDVVRLLLEAGADRAVRDANGKTALMVAEEAGKGAVVQLLRSNSIHFSSKAQVTE